MWGRWIGGGKDEEEIEFKNAMEVEGVDFGRHVMAPGYHVKLAGLNDLQDYLDDLGAESRHGDGSFLTKARFNNCPVSIYLPTDNTQLFQSVLSKATFGAAAPRAKVLLFYFDGSKLKKQALEHFPHNVVLRDVKSLLIHPFHQHNSHLARFKIKKGRVTIYLYVVKRKNKSFKGKKAFRKLRADISDLKKIDDHNPATLGIMGQIIPVIVPVLLAVLSI